MALLAILLGLTVFTLANPLNRQILLDGDGVIDEGAKFGVEIGQDMPSVLLELEELGLDLTTTRLDGTCQGQEFGPGKDVHVFRDVSIRNGVICTVSDGGKLEAIGWFFMPLDF